MPPTDLLELRKEFTDDRCYQEVVAVSVRNPFAEAAHLLRGFTTHPAADVSGEVDIVSDFSQVCSRTMKRFLFFPVTQDAQFSYRQPLEVMIQCRTEAPGYIAFNDDLEKYAFGATIDDALEAFEDRLVADFRSLLQTPASILSEDAKESLARYRKIYQLHASKEASRN